MWQEMLNEYIGNVKSVLYNYFGFEKVDASLGYAVLKLHGPMISKYFKTKVIT